MASAAWLGLAVASIAALQFVCRFGEAAGAAKAQKQRYVSLLGRMSGMSDELLSERLEHAHEHDSRPLASIEHIAYNKACISRGQDDCCKPLSRFHRFVALFCGGHPYDTQVSSTKTTHA